MMHPSSNKGNFDKKRSKGRPANPTPLSRRTVEIPDDLWSWALNQPEGGARLIRDLLSLERKRRSLGPSATPTPGELKVATAGGVMIATEVAEGMVVLFEEELALQCLYDTSWKCLRVHVPSRIDPLETRMARARLEGQTRESDAAGADGALSPDGPEQDSNP